MAVSGAWKQKQAVAYSGALRQGTGWNPVHAINDRSGRNIAPEGNSGQVPDDITVDDPYGYTTEDHTSQLWGYGTETGTADRPGLGTEDIDTRGAMPDDWPSYGPAYKSGIPGGTRVRSRDHGAEATVTAKTTQSDAQQGWLDKQVGDLEDAQVSDPRQYEMQTSMTQMRQTRAGSQRGSGSASEYSAPVPGTRRTMRQRLLILSGMDRHYEMTPRRQDLLLRPFAYRTAGTGNPELMAPNSMYQSQPLQRTPNADPWQGQEVPATDVTGFVDEGWNI